MLIDCYVDLEEKCDTPTYYPTYYNVLEPHSMGYALGIQVTLFP